MCPNNDLLRIIDLEADEIRHDEDMLQQLLKLMSHRFAIFGFEIFRNEKFFDLSSDKLRRGLPLAFENLADHVGGNNKPQRGGHYADTNETMNCKAGRKIRVFKDGADRWSFQLHGWRQEGRYPPSTNLVAASIT